VEDGNMNKRVVIFGAGGFGREVLNIYIDLRREEDVKGFVEERSERIGDLINGKPVYDMTCLDRASQIKKLLVVLAIGSTKRKRLAEMLSDMGYNFDTVVHPNTIRSRWIDIQEGSIVAAGTILTCQIDIGRHVIINLATSVGHDVKIGDYVTISPGAKIMGGVTIGREVFVGTNATILENKKVGDGAVVAAGAIVTQDVPEMALVAGMPAAVKKIYRSDEEKPW
jgi:sugar O-acyltransferase (sialic acid O-acetyltransferase NeuD family)